MASVFAGEYECPRCGCGSKDLKPEALARVVSVLGGWVKLKCWVCKLVFMGRIDG